MTTQAKEAFVVVAVTQPEYGPEKQEPVAVFINHAEALQYVHDKNQLLVGLGRHRISDNEMQYFPNQRQQELGLDFFGKDWGMGKAHGYCYMTRRDLFL